MDRKEFLSMLGLSAAAFTIASCAQGCSKSSLGANPPTVDFTLNLLDPANANLHTGGGYIYQNGLIIARTVGGAYIAVSQTCTHSGNIVVFEGAQNDFFCPAHSSTFATSGLVTGGPAPTNLKSYNTALNGSSLHIWG